jgi:hypothetical protein
MQKHVKKKTLTLKGLINSSIQDNNFLDGNVMKFLHLFFICDTLARIIISKVDNVDHKDVHLDVRVIKRVYKAVGLNLNDDLLNIVYGSSKKASMRSAKVLRNMYAHNLSKSAKNEIINRKVFLEKSIMDVIIQIRDSGDLLYKVEVLLKQ